MITDSKRHIAVCPSAGIGHLAPFLRLASMLSHSNACIVTLVIIRPTLSTAETTQIDNFLSTHPHVISSEFHALPPEPSTGTVDPFCQKYDAVSDSARLLADHLSALSPTPNAVFSDLMLASGLNKALSDRVIDCYNLITSSARFFSLLVSRDRVKFVKGEDVEIPGLATIQANDVPLLLHNMDYGMARMLDQNCKHLPDAKGVILNTFDFFELEAISALQNGKLLSNFPPVFPIGPLQSLPPHKGSNGVPWLDGQPSKSVVFVSFGSRTALSKEQIKEIGEGLEKSAVRFLWVIKTTVLDKEDKEELHDLLSDAFFEKTKERGLIVKGWVNQEEILSHPAIGGFVSHCGWNSVMESAQKGLPLLAWPIDGDQMINAGVLETAGLGIRERDWVRGGDKLVKGDEIADRIKELMTSEKLKDSARRVGEEATKAWEKDGSSSKMFSTIIGMSLIDIEA